MTRENKNDLNTFFTELIKTLVSVIEEKEEFFKGHAQRVAQLSVELTRKVKGPQARTDSIYLASLLHDIGMVYIPTEIIQKPGALSAAELEEVQQHPARAEHILSNMSLFRDVLPIIRHHHEAVDGGGYPDGLRGEDIPLEARILRIVDGYDAMISERPHRPALSQAEALEAIQQESGQVYDPSLLQAFNELVNPDPQTASQSSVHDLVMEMVKSFKQGQIKLPVMPNVVQRIEEVIKQPNSTASDLAEIIEQEPTISLRLLTIANSALYGGAGRVTKIKQAVSRIGTKETQSIVTAIASRNLYQTDNKLIAVIIEQLWQHSLATAYAARAIAKDLELAEADKYFLMGLVHDIGKTLLLQALSDIILKTPGSYDLGEIMTSIQEIHAEFGAALLKRWEFPEELIEVVRVHESDEISQDMPMAQLILDLANRLTRTINFSLHNDDPTPAREIISGKILRIPDGKLEFIARKVSHLMELTDGLEE